LALWRKGVVEEVAIVVGIWVRVLEKGLVDIVRGGGFQESCEKVRIVGACWGEWGTRLAAAINGTGAAVVSVLGEEWAMARAWAVVGNSGGGIPLAVTP